MHTVTAQKNVFPEGVERLLTEFGIRLTPDEQLKGFVVSPRASLWKARNDDKDGITPEPYHDADVRIVWKPGSHTQESAFRLLIEERHGSNNQRPTAHDYRGWHEIHLVAGARALACQVFNGREYLAKPTSYIEGRLQEEHTSYTDVRPDVNESAHIGEDAAFAIVRTCLQFLQKYLRRQEVRQTVLDWFIAHGLGTQCFQHPELPRVTLARCGPHEHLDAEFRSVGNERGSGDLKTAVAFCIHGHSDHDLKGAAFLARFTHDPEAQHPWQSEYVSRLPKGQDGPVIAMVQQRDVAGVLGTMDDCYEYYRRLLKAE